MSAEWYARPVVAVRDAPRALAFYVGKLGFAEDWRHDEAGRLRIVQVSRQRCELILSDQWPEAAGQAVTFVSLDAAEFASAKQAFAERDVAVKAGRWGYALMIVEDPDGNRLWFPEPGA